MNFKHLNWRYTPQSSRRDLRLDFLRGYFVVIMSINHLYLFPAWTLPFTGGGQLWFTAAEGFILVSGIVFGQLYRRRAAEWTWHKVFSFVARRAMKLYLLAVGGQILFASGDYILREWRGRPTRIPEGYWEIVEGAVLQIHYSYPYLDLLVLYALLLLWGSGAIYLLATQNRWKAVLFGSFILWYAWQQEPKAFSVFRANFNFAVWQFLFVLGLLGGYYRQRLVDWWQGMPLPRWLMTLLFFAPAFMVLWVNFQVTFHDWQMPELFQIVTDGIERKNYLALNRIIFALWLFGAFYLFVSWFWQPLNKALGWLLLTLGQSSLLAYLIQALLSYFIRRLPGYPFATLGPVVMGCVHVAVVLLLWLFVRQLRVPFQAWLRGESTFSQSVQAGWGSKPS